VSWIGEYGDDVEIYIFDGFQVTCISDNLVNDYAPDTDGELVAWHGSDGNDQEIFLYDGTSVIQLTDNSYDDFNPQIHDGQAAWRARIYTI